MPNGNHALKLLAPEPASAVAQASNSDAAPAATAIQVGTAMADAVESVGRSLADLDAGGLTDTNRTRGGEAIAALVELRLLHFGTMPEFADVALAEGRNVLNARHRAVLRQQLGTDAGIDDTFNMLLSHILAVATKVAAVELAFRSN